MRYPGLEAEIAVDKSALLAIVLGEDDAAQYMEALIAHEGKILVSAPTWTEALIVAERRAGSDAVRDLRKLHATADMHLADLTPYMAEMAFEGWRQFGKGNHPARLNLGDCYSYALARSLEIPLLYKGDDFAETDIVSAL